MNNTMKCFLMFMLGGAVGAGATAIYLKDTYKKIAQEEIDSVKETFSEKEKELKKKAAGMARNKPTDILKEKVKSDYRSFVNSLDYGSENVEDEEPESYFKSSLDNSDEDLPHDITATDEEEQASNPSTIPDIQYISPEVFDALDYDQIDLTYYADGVLADDMGSTVSKNDIALSVGTNFVDHFGDFYPDACYVRNNKLKADYEILRDNSVYAKAAVTDHPDVAYYNNQTEDSE